MEQAQPGGPLVCHTAAPSPQPTGGPMQQRVATTAAGPSALTAIALVVTAALATDVAAQISLGWPVPITFQTLVVLGSGAYLGARLGLASQLLYGAQGAAG